MTILLRDRPRVLLLRDRPRVLNKQINKIQDCEEGWLVHDLDWMLENITRLCEQRNYM